jgi:dihydrofolate synthase/folylpolyglutamate synthase
LVAADPLEYLFNLEQIGIKFGLENIRAIVGVLGHPERAFRSVHVAGTNGKGSVTALVDAGLRAAGHRSGRYTSPHLIDLTERFAVDGRAVSIDDLRESAAAAHAAIRALLARGALHSDPTFFEVTTAVAFDLFRRARVDAAVCEVGLGGRLDATNVLAPVATAIVSIGLDHEEYLGTTVAAIAAEKAGIIKPGVPVVVGDLDAESDAVISQIARELGAPVVRATEQARVDGLRTLADGRQTFHLRTASIDYGPITLALSGAHQVTNALVAVAVLEALADAGLGVPPDAVRRGFADVVWPGRLQRIVLDDERGLLLDAAHNPAGARSLAAFLAQGAPHPLVFGAMRDKNIGAILEALVPYVSAIVTTRADTRRAAEPDVVADIVGRMAPDLPVRAVASPRDALTAAWKLDREIVVAGSIFLLGDVLRALKRSGERPATGGGPSRP